MPLKTDPDLGINSWLEDELYQQYLNDRTAVDESWKHVFEDAPNGHTALGPSPALPLARSAAPSAPSPENLQPLRGIAAKIAENMNASVTIPLATSQRVIPVKVMDENRRIINQHRTLVGKSKVSYTHLIGWAILKGLEDFPGLNHAYGESNGQPARIVHPQINLGIAVDVAGKDGGRNLLVPNIKNAGSLDFAQYVTTFDGLVDRARKGKLAPADFQDTTISLTNPGTVGTMTSSPRLMNGQGAIVAAGAGALCLCSDPALAAGIELAAITDAHTFTARLSRAQAALAMRRQLGAPTSGELLADGLGGSPRSDAAEAAAWSDWQGPRVSPKRLLGEGLMAAAAWQCVAACDALALGRAPAASVSLVGSNQQAIGARFIRPC